MNKMKSQHVSYVSYGSLYCKYSDCIVEQPAVLINIGDDTLHKWGNVNKLEHSFERYYKSVALVEGEETAQTNIRLITLSNLTAEQQSYVINRMAEHTLSGFVREFAHHALHDPDCIDWLNKEMVSFPYPIQ